MKPLSTIFFWGGGQGIVLNGCGGTSYELREPLMTLKNEACYEDFSGIYGKISEMKSNDGYVLMLISQNLYGIFRALWMIMPLGLCFVTSPQNFQKWRQVSHYSDNLSRATLECWEGVLLYNS